MRRRKTLQDQLIPLHDRKSVMSEKSIKFALFQNFDKYDKNGDGTLDHRELTLFFKDVIDRKGNGKHHNPEELASRFIHMIDLDNDNKLTREEIYQFYKD